MNPRILGGFGLVALIGGAYYMLGGDDGPEPVFTPENISEADKALARESYLAVQRAVKNVIGRSDPAIVQYVFAVGRLETGWGRWSFRGTAGEKIPNQNNWGSIHCKPGETACFGASDAHSHGSATGTEAEGTRYPQTFRAYATPTEGAEDLVREMLVRRPQVLRALTVPRPTIVGASIAMRRTTYVEGWCPKAKAQYGVEAVKGSFAKPDASTAHQECAKEAIVNHAKTAAQALATYLPPTNQALALRFGSYKRDFSDYRRREGV